MFVITDGNNFLKRDSKGNYVPVTNISFATKWEDLDKASKALTNCVNKNLRARYSVTCITSHETNTNKSEEHLTMEFKQELLKRIGSQDSVFNSEYSVSDSINAIVSLISSSTDNKARLNEQLSQVDKEISDIEHYIEFGDNLNAYQGYLAYKCLKNRLEYRRKIKNELVIVTHFSEHNELAETLSNIAKSIDGFNTRKYSPRVFTELF